MNTQVPRVGATRDWPQKAQLKSTSKVNQDRRKGRRAIRQKLWTIFPLLFADFFDAFRGQYCLLTAQERWASSHAATVLGRSKAFSAAGSVESGRSMSPSKANFSDSDFTQTRRPVGLGPSSQTWPRWQSHRAHRISSSAAIPIAYARRHFPWRPAEKNSASFGAG